MKKSRLLFRICFIASFLIVSRLMSMEFQLMGVNTQTNEVFILYNEAGSNQATFERLFPVRSFRDVLDLITTIHDLAKLVTPLALEGPAPLPKEIYNRLSNLKEDLHAYLNLKVAENEELLRPGFEEFWKSLPAERQRLVQGIFRRFNERERLDGCMMLTTYGCVSISTVVVFLLTSYLSCE